MLIEAMAGAAGTEAIAAEAAQERAQAPEGPAILEVRNLSSPPAFADISFSVRAGEILGLAGLVGAGRSEIVRAIAGIDRPASGEVLIDGKPAHFVTAAQAIGEGIVLLPEDRQVQGLIPQLSVGANVSLSVLDRLVSAFGLLSLSRERSLGDEYVGRFRIHCAGLDQPVSELSGGNQQKVMVARTLAPHPRVLLLDEPTRGVDVAAKADIHRWIRDFAKGSFANPSGMAVILISSELHEVAALSHRVLVLRDGRLVAEVPGEGSTEKSLLALAAGQPAEAYATSWLSVGRGFIPAALFGGAL